MRIKLRFFLLLIVVTGFAVCAAVEVFMQISLRQKVNRLREQGALVNFSEGEITIHFGPLCCMEQSFSDADMPKLVTGINSFPRIETLSFSEPDLTNVGFASLLKLDKHVNVDRLIILDCAIDDSCIETFCKLGNFKAIRFLNCDNLTSNGVERLRQCHPNSEISFSNE